MFPDGVFVEYIALNELDGLDSGPFLPELSRIWRQGTSRDTSNICVMATGCDVEYDSVIVKVRGDDRDIWEMGSTADYKR